MPVQFLEASSKLEVEAVNNADVSEWDGHTIRVMTPEYLAAIALSVGRPKDRARLVYLYSLQDFQLRNFTEILKHHSLTQTWLNWAKGLGIEEK
jgi:hypothetical protein